MKKLVLIASVLVSGVAFAAPSRPSLQSMTQSMTCTTQGLRAELVQIPPINADDVPRIILKVKEEISYEPEIFTSLVGANHDRLADSFSRVGDYVDFSAIHEASLATLTVVGPSTLQLTGKYAAVLTCKVNQ